MSTRSLFLGLACWTAALAAGAAPPTSCIQCHGNFEWIQNSNWVQMVREFTSIDVHQSFGLSCQDCHGGNPDAKLAEDSSAAMDKNFQPNPFRGAPKRTDVPDFCGRCHTNATYMHGFRPDVRVDELPEYWTSQHGKLLKTGDTNVATCIDCHSVHNIRRTADPQAPVYPTAIAGTCRRCHSDPKRMGRYKLPDGRPLPIDQYQRWRRSVHAAAMYDKADLSAPTCNDCHGDHGATPPNLASIVFVCGQCHSREAGLFRNSPKEKGFKEHNETYLPQMGKNHCAECHDPPEPAAAITNITQFSECITCHGNHAVISPRITMLGPLPETPCAFCHEGVQPAVSVEEPKIFLQHYQEVKAALLAQASAQGLTGDARFDWLVEQALNLPAHGVAKGQPGKIGRHQFYTLFQKFRIGTTFFTYPDPVTGQPVKEKLVRCTDCHGPKSRGFAVSETMMRSMHGLIAETAKAERTLQAAARGGVEVRKVQLQVDKAVDAQIQVQALVHTFAAQTNSPFMQKYTEGVGIAQNVLSAGLQGLAELSYRHKGLLIFLGITLLVLAGLALKIRELSRRDTPPK